MLKLAVSVAAGFGSAYLLLRRLLDWHLERSKQKYPLPVLDQEPQKHAVEDGQLYSILHLAAMDTDQPLVVLIHGLGAQMVQFQKQIKFFYGKGCAVLAVDLLGHGGSDNCADPVRFSVGRQSQDLQQIIMKYRVAQQQVVLVGHSFGCALIALLFPKISSAVSHCVLIAPTYQLSESSHSTSRILLFRYLPNVVIDCMRVMDRRGGLSSRSVNRVVSQSATPKIRRLQMAINLRSRTQTVKMFSQLKDYPSRDHWQALQQVPTLIICGEEDTVSPVDRHSQPLKRLLGSKCGIQLVDGGHCPHVENSGAVNDLMAMFLQLKSQQADDADEGDDAGESMTGSKWSLKNYEKWKATVPVSDLIEGTNIRGMKVLRQDDRDHSPAEFSRRYEKIRMVIDISKETPPYDTQLSFAQYHKIGTTSKVPPSVEEVDRICQLITDFNGLLENEDFEIAVHCHYGFNRTGFILCGYLCKMRGLTVDQALRVWEKARYPGIRHEHFKEELRKRYGRSGALSTTAQRLIAQPASDTKQFTSQQKQQQTQPQQM